MRLWKCIEGESDHEKTDLAWRTGIRRDQPVEEREAQNF